MDHDPREIARTDEHPLGRDIAELHMVDRRYADGDRDRLPVADQGQRCQADEEKHMAFHLPGMALQHVDQQRGMNCRHDPEGNAGCIVVSFAQRIIGRNQVDRRRQHDGNHLILIVEQQGDEQQRGSRYPPQHGEHQDAPNA